MTLCLLVLTTQNGWLDFFYQTMIKEVIINNEFVYFLMVKDVKKTLKEDAKEKKLQICYQ